MIVAKAMLDEFEKVTGTCFGTARIATDAGPDHHPGVSPEIHPSAKIVWELARFLSDARARGDGCHRVSRTTPTGVCWAATGRNYCSGKKWMASLWSGDGTSPRLLLPSSCVRRFTYPRRSGPPLPHLAGSDPDVIINFGPPLVGPILSLMMAKAFGARHIPVIYDLYPDVAIEMGTVTNGAIIRAAKAVERMVYRESDRIVVLSEGFRRILVDDKGVPEEKVRVIPVWIDLEEIRRAKDPFSWRVRHGIPRDAFVVLYAGTIGLVSGAEIMVKVAREWAATPDVLFLFVGEGKVKERVQSEARGLSNIKFFGFPAKGIYWRTCSRPRMSG